MTAPTDAAIEVDGLPPTQYLILEVLAARYRLGEPAWNFPTRLVPPLRALSRAGLIGWKHWTVQGSTLAWLTDAGRRAVLSDGYPVRHRGDRVRVVVVVNRERGTVHGLTCDDAEAQQWVRDLIAVHGDPLAATMTVDLVNLPARTEAGT